MFSFIYVIRSSNARGPIHLRGPYPRGRSRANPLVVFWQMTISNIKLLLNKFALQIIMLKKALY